MIFRINKHKSTKIIQKNISPFFRPSEPQIISPPTSDGPLVRWPPPNPLRSTWCRTSLRRSCFQHLCESESQCQMYIIHFVIYVYVYVCKYIYIYKYIYMYVYIYYVYVYICMYIYVLVYMHDYIYTQRSCDI